MTRFRHLTIARIRPTLERVCRAVAPELADVPLYIVGTDEVRGLRGNRAGAAGLTGSMLDLVLAPHVGDRWHGRGSAMLLSDRALRRSAYGLPKWWGKTLEELFLAVAIGMTLHEFAHILDGEFFGREEFAPSKVTRVAAVVAEEMTTAVSHYDPRAVVPFLSHEATFIRFMLHCAYRAYAAGNPPLFFGLGDLRHYGLTSLSGYSLDLDDEPERLAGLTFAEIRSTLPPSKFAHRWNLDVTDWAERLTSHHESLRETLAAFATRRLIPLQNGSIMSTSTIEKVIANQRSRKEQRAEKFRELVKQVGSGTVPKPEAVESVLDESGKTVEDLAAAVKVYQRRAELYAQFAKVPALNADREKNVAAIAKRTAEFEAAESAYRQDVSPFQWRVQEIDEALQQAQQAHTELERTGNNETLLERRGELARQRAEIDAELRRLAKSKDDALTFANGRDALAEKGTGAVHAEYAGEAENLRKRAAGYAEQIEALRANVVSLDEQERQLAEEMLKP